jgi:hypothetical protein
MLVFVLLAPVSDAMVLESPDPPVTVAVAVTTLSIDLTVTGCFMVPQVYVNLGRLRHSQVSK